jgi:mannose-6-phosphate isomerase-like protein (cupin superfamily)
MGKMKVNTQDIAGTIVRETAVYTVIDNAILNNLTLSKTILHPTHTASGHFHDDLDEVYFFQSGYGNMQLGDEIIPVKPGDIVLIPGGMFHKVMNDEYGAENDLEFICVFQSYAR